MVKREKIEIEICGMNGCKSGQFKTLTDSFNKTRKEHIKLIKCKKCKNVKDISRRAEDIKHIEYHDTDTEPDDKQYISDRKEDGNNE